MAVGSMAGRLAVVTRSLPGAGGDTMLETQGDWTGHPCLNRHNSYRVVTAQVLVGVAA